MEGGEEEEEEIERMVAKLVQPSMSETLAFILMLNASAWNPRMCPEEKCENECRCKIYVPPK